MPIVDWRLRANSYVYAVFTRSQSCQALGRSRLAGHWPLTGAGSVAGVRLLMFI